MTSATDPKTILLKGQPQYREGIADAALTPGELVEQMTTGNFRKHATAAGVMPSKLFAREEEYVGGGIDVAYAASDTFPYMACQSGDQVYALVAASAVAIVIGDLLESAGDGTLRKVTALITDSTGGTASATTIANLADGTTYATDHAALENNLATIALALNSRQAGFSAVARAIEAVDNSGGGSEARIKVEIV